MNQRRHYKEIQLEPIGNPSQARTIKEDCTIGSQKPECLCCHKPMQICPLICMPCSQKNYVMNIAFLYFCLFFLLYLLFSFTIVRSALQHFLFSVWNDIQCCLEKDMSEFLFEGSVAFGQDPQPRLGSKKQKGMIIFFFFCLLIFLIDFSSCGCITYKRVNF